MMTTVLALDIATRSGWACSRNGAIASGVAVFAPGEHPGARAYAFKRWLTEQKAYLGDIDFIVWENAFHQKGQASAVFQQFVGVLLAWACHHGVGVMPVATSTIKKFATEHGDAGKDEMIAAARAAGFNPSDDNEADALNLLRLVLAHNPNLGGQQ